MQKNIIEIFIIENKLLWGRIKKSYSFLLMNERNVMNKLKRKKN